MFFRILLLILLISCVYGTFEVNVTHSSYQAEENRNVTMEWTFTTDPVISSMFIYCFLERNDRFLVLFYLDEGVELPEKLNERFVGRVHCDVLREGRIRLHMSRLRADDSGLYRCEVSTEHGDSSQSCRLEVTTTAAEDEPEPQRPTVTSPAVTSQPGSERCIYVALELIAAALLALCVGLCFIYRVCSKSLHKKQSLYSLIDVEIPRGTCHRD